MRTLITAQMIKRSYTILFDLQIGRILKVFGYRMCAPRFPVSNLRTNHILLMGLAGTIATAYLVDTDRSHW